MEIRAREIKMVPLSEIRLNPKNRNQHPQEQIDRIVKIIEHSGFRRPGTISNQTGLLVCGEGRYLAAKKMGLKEMPVMFQDYDSPEQEYADGVADNALDKWASLDLAAINADLPDLGPDLDLDLLGIKDFVLEPTEKLEPGCDEDEVPENADTRCKLGDVWQLGRNRLVCGDSVSATDLQKLMGNERASITFTSPPYNAGKFEVTGAAARGKSMGREQKYLNNSDDMTAEQFEEFFESIIGLYCSVSDSVMVNIALLEPNKRAVLRVVAKFVDLFKDTIYWRKSTSTPHIQPGIMTAVVEPIFCFGEHNSRQFKSAQFKGNFNNVIEGANASGNEFAKVHAATFPFYLPETIIEQFTAPGASVIDCFGGTGTTLIACEKTNRRCFMMEIDPHYCDVILARWEKYTGKTAERVDG